MNIYQNNLINCKGVPKEGCLFMSLVDCAAEGAGHDPSVKKIENCYDILSKLGAIGSETNKFADGAFVWDHEAILNTMYGCLSTDNKKWTYLAAIYTDFELSRGKQNYMPHKDYLSRSTHMIFQVQTVFGGHFRRFDYEPWKGGTTERYLKSVRYYELA